MQRHGILCPNEDDENDTILEKMSNPKKTK